LSILCYFILIRYVIYRRYFKFGSILHHPDDALRSKLKTVGALNVFCMVCFLIRAVLEILQLFYDLVSLIWLVFFYWFLLEAIPLALMLVVLKASYWDDDGYHRSVIAPRTYAQYQSTTNTSSSRTPLLTSTTTTNTTRLPFNVSTSSPQSY
jgi:hypothetical protein